MKERLPYVVSKLPKDSTGYYCHMRNYPNIPVFGSIGGGESSRERKKMVLVDECVTDCGNMKCRFNSANIKEKNVRMVFMRDNPKMGCEGYKRVAKKAERKGKAGEIATVRADAPEKKANAPEKAGRITERREE